MAQVEQQENPPPWAERGADVAWLSAFPGEKEVLFPPLTYLSPTGRTQKVGDRFTIVEVTPRL